MNAKIGECLFYKHMLTMSQRCAAWEFDVRGIEFFCSASYENCPLIRDTPPLLLLNAVAERESKRWIMQNLHKV